MYDYSALALLLADAAVLAIIVLQPLSRRYDDSDRGRSTVVDMPAFGRPSLPRAGSFLAVSAVVGTCLVLSRHPSVIQLYHQALLRLLTWVISDPSLVNAYAGRLIPLAPSAFAGYLVTVAIVMPGTVGRRIMILLHAPLFIAWSLLTDCLLGLAVTALHVQPWPARLISMYLQYLVGCLVVFRLFFTSYQLPKLTPVPRLRRGHLRDSLILIPCLLGAASIVFAVTLVLYREINVDTVVGPIVLIPAQAVIIELLAVFLVLVRAAAGRAPDPPTQRPPLDVIIPAYNESVCIERVLRSIDRAAGRYGGPVRVIMCDDGSTDDTKALAHATMASLGYATAEVIEGTHSGKSKALNMALERCTAEFVYRLDADCALDQDAFVYSVTQFAADPRVGLVGALQMPKEPYSTWIYRMRAFELFYMFGFLRVALAQVDAVRGPRQLLRLPPRGSAGRRRLPDRDVQRGHRLHLRHHALGYRAAIDTRVVSYEDVPTTIRQLRIQRFRWGIGSRLVFPASIRSIGTSADRDRASGSGCPLPPPGTCWDLCTSSCG